MEIPLYLKHEALLVEVGMLRIIKMLQRMELHESSKRKITCAKLSVNLIRSRRKNEKVWQNHRMYISRNRAHFNEAIKKQFVSIKTVLKISDLSIFKGKVLRWLQFPQISRWSRIRKKLNKNFAQAQVLFLLPKKVGKCPTKEIDCKV